MNLNTDNVFLNLLSCNTPAQTLLKSIINSLWEKLFLKLPRHYCKEPKTLLERKTFAFTVAQN